MTTKRIPNNKVVHVSKETHKRLLANYIATGEPMSVVTDKAVNKYLDEQEDARSEG
jgi:hypothetical protein